CRRDAAAWRYELDGRSPASMLHSTLLTLETPDSPQADAIAGFVALGSGGFPGPPQPATTVAVRRFELAPGGAWHAPTHALLRHLTGKTGGGPPLPETPPTYQEVHLLLGDDHPAYATAPSVLGHALPPGAWYVRVPDLPAFVRRITPVLEARLA